MPGRLTILHVLEATGHGTGRHLVDLVRHVPADHHVALPVAPTGRGESDPGATAAALVDLGATVHPVPMRRSPLHPDLVRAVRAVRELVGTVAPAVVHGHATVGGTVARLAAARRAPCVYTPNGLHPARPVRFAERLLAPLADHVIAVSESEARLLTRLRVAAPDRVSVIPNGIDLAPPPPAALDLRSRLGLPSAARLVGAVGRLARQKAPDVLVAAAADLPEDVHVVFVGGGPDAEDVRRLVERAGLGGRVHLLGHVGDAPALLPQFDVVALPSRWEGAPYVPLEAFRAGVPVVATAVVGTVDVVRHGRTGLLVPADDPDALAGAIRRVLADPALADALVRAARTDLAERFDVVRAGARTARLYADLAATRRASV